MKRPLLLLMLAVGLSAGLHSARGQSTPPPPPPSSAPGATVRPASTPVPTDRPERATPPTAAPVRPAAAPTAPAAAPAPVPTRPVPVPTTAAMPANRAPASASALPPPTVPRVEAFRIIFERNMFNAHRIGLTPRSSREGRDASGDIITLVGTLIEEKRAMAFFDSGDPRYRRVLREGSRLPSGHTLKKVEPDGIVIARDTTTAKVQVTQRLHRMDNGDWEILQPEAGSLATASGSSVTDPSKPTTPGAVPVVPPNASDALRRLMELRQKQLKE